LTRFIEQVPQWPKRTETGGIEGVFSNRYSHLLSPIKIVNVVLKSCMMATRSMPFHLQGPEIFPADPVMSHVINVARDGAAVITISVEKYNLDDSAVQNYIAQLTDVIHFYGVKIINLLIDIYAIKHESTTNNVFY
jgi:hypothetical protein